MREQKKIDVLFVDDSLDDSELTVFAMRLAHESFHFLHFTDGAEALNFIFAKKKYEDNKIQSGLRLVVLDLRLPTIGGLDILKKIREDQATRTLPVVILTSSRDEHDILVAYALGANSYVVKPDNFDGYVKKIGSLASYWGTINERPN